MKEKFENLKALADWLVKNGNRKQRYYYSLNVNTCEMEVSDTRIRPSKNKIVRHPDEIGKHYRESWFWYIGNAFGGLICKSKLSSIVGKKNAEIIEYDGERDNPYYKCADPMKLYLVDRINIIKEKRA